jgi:hypothetical protein
MALFEQYKVTAAEMGLAADFEATEKTLELFIAHANATVAARDSYTAWRSWNGGRTKTEYAKEDQRLKYLYHDAEHAQAKTHAELQIALMGEEAWTELKRAEQEAADEAFEAQLQADFEA